MDSEITGRGRTLGAALSADHAALEATLTRFCVELSSGREEMLHALWRKVESDFGTHLRAEEKLILPSFERAYPHHGAMIRRHHDQLRKALECMNVALSRGELDAHRVEELLEVLRGHARHEEVVFYYWAELHLDDVNAKQVIEQLRAASPRRDGKALKRG